MIGYSPLNRHLMPRPAAKESLKDTSRRTKPLRVLLLGVALTGCPVVRPQAARPVALAANSGASQALAEDPNWQAICAEALAQALPTPAARLASAAKLNGAAGKACDEQALYYGFSGRPDYRAALDCAYRHRAHPEQPAAGLLDGSGTLAMLYANGDVVPRNYPLAIRFACEVKDRGGQNNEQRIGRLEALRDANPASKERFDLCDEQMSGVMAAYCSELQGKQEDVGRARRIDTLRDRLPEQARDLLPALQAAESAFEDARMRGEYTGGGGSGSTGFALADQSRLREQFVINLERFAAGTLPRAAPAQREAAEQGLQAASRAVQAMPPPDPNAPHLAAGPPTPEGFAATQAAWRSLFDEWMRFVPIAYPELSIDAAATELLRLRIHQLKEVVR